MKHISYISLVVVLLSICGCESAESEVVLPQSGTTTITVGLQQTKTSLGASENGVRKVLWSSGDRIVANGEVSNEAILAPENSGVATFNFGSELTYPLTILYPASFYKDATTVTLPAIQEANIHIRHKVLENPLMYGYLQKLCLDNM